MKVPTILGPTIESKNKTQSILYILSSIINIKWSSMGHKRNDNQVIVMSVIITAITKRYSQIY